MKRTLVASFLTFVLTFALSYGMVAQAQTIPSISPFFVNASNQITQRVANTSIFLTGLSDGCLGLSSGVITSTGSACGSGGGGGSGVATTSLLATYPVQVTKNTASITYSLAFGTTTPNIWSNLQTFTSGFISQASSTISVLHLGTALEVASGGTGSTTLTGLLKGNGTGSLLSAIADTDYQAPIILTTTGNSGPATFIGDTLNIPQSFAYPFPSNATSTNINFSSGLSIGGTSLTNTTGSGGVIALQASPTLTGTVTAPAIKGGTNANSTLTLESTSNVGTTDSIVFKTGSQVVALTLDTNQKATFSSLGSGLVKSTSGQLSNATGDADYQNPIILTTTGSSGAATFSGDTLNIPQYSGTTYTGTYPIQISGSVISTAFSTTTVNTYSALQTFSGGATIANTLTLSGVTGSTQCLQVSSSGVVSGTGSACGTGSGGVTSVSQTYGTSQAGSIVFATTTDSFNGLSFNENITNSGSTFTFSNGISGTLGVAGGGTGSTTLGGLLKGNGTGSLITAVAGTDYLAPTSISALYPLAYNSGTGVFSSAFGTTTSNTFGGTQTFTNAPDFASLSNGTVNVSGTAVYSTATSTITTGTGISYSGTLGALIGGTSGTLTNTGVTSLTAGTGISLSGSTGGVTITASGSGTGTVSTSSSETAGYFPTWTNTNGTPALLSGTSQIFQSGSNIGIGTTSPIHALDIVGTGIINSTFASAGTFSNPDVDLIGSRGAGGATFATLTFVNREGSAIPATATTTAQIAAFPGINSDASQLTFSTTPHLGSLTEALRIDQNGSIGIGTSTPSRLLSVQGNQYTSGTSFFGGAITATSTLQLSALGTPAGTFLAADANGFVIATTAPSFSSLTGVVPIANGGTATTTGGLTGGVEYFDGTKITNSSGLTFNSGSNALIVGGVDVTFTLGQKQNLVTLTTTGSSGVATFNQSTGALNIPNYAGAAYPFAPGTENAIAVQATTTAPIADLTPGLALDVSVNGWYGIGGVLLAYASSTTKDTVLGINALNKVATTSAALHNDTAIGYEALQLATAATSQDTAVGSLAAEDLTSGTSNTAVGAQAMPLITTGSDNAAFGFQAGDNANAGASNDTFIGYESDDGAASGAITSTTIVGSTAGANNSGNQNTYIGAQAGVGGTTGSQNVALGYDGALPVAAGSGQLNIQNIIYGNGNTGTGVTLSTGNIGIGTTTPTARFVTQAASTTAATVLTPYTGLVSIISGLENTTLMLFQEIDQWGHLITSGDTPTVTGGTSSVSGNDRNGTITVTGTALTSVTLNFAHPYRTAPDCTESDNSTALTADINSISTTQMVIGFSIGVSSQTVWYICQQHQ